MTIYVYSIRDLQADLFPYFDVILSSLVPLTNRLVSAASEKPGPLSLDPETTGKIFECISHIFRSDRSYIVLI